MLRIISRMIAAAAVGAVGYAEGSFMFAWPLWASAAIGCGGVWAGMLAFQPVERPPRRPPRRGGPRKKAKPVRAEAEHREPRLARSPAKKSHSPEGLGNG
jgi:hypothetical protein